jgi:hypothetical protein
MKSPIDPLTTGVFPMLDGGLVVEVASVSIETIGQASLVHLDSFRAILDSTLPYLLLPDIVCDLFVEQFGLVENTVLGVFTINIATNAANVLAVRKVSLPNQGRKRDRHR